MHNNFLYTQGKKKKQAVNFMEQMTFCVISRGKNAEWMFQYVKRMRN